MEIIDGQIWLLMKVLLGVLLGVNKAIWGCLGGEDGLSESLLLLGLSLVLLGSGLFLRTGIDIGVLP